MSIEELRVRALELAVGALEGHPAADVLILAGRFAAYLIDGDTGQSPRAAINAALDAAGVK